MTTTVSYTEARAKLADLWDMAVQDREPVVIQRRGSEDVALIAVSELEGIMETAHLLRSPANAERIARALERAKSRTTKPRSLESLMNELGFDEPEKQKTAKGKRKQ